LLLECCKIPDLVIISGALDAFYDVFAEECYNYALKDFDVIEQMELGLPGLKQMVSNLNKSPFILVFCM
jgi:hypothetical protein